uniref:Uncharacterized protein n=1 Tax=Magallana gigas TaxID=29159 RepID=K1PPF5_MAGGI
MINWLNYNKKILADKQSIPCKGLGELCYDIFYSYSKADECTLSQDRMHATILLNEKAGRPQKWERLEEIDKRRTEKGKR